MTRYVEKPWGSETIWAATDHYVGKILFVRSGHALSVQYHEIKDETMYVLEGRGLLYLYPPDVLKPETPVLPWRRIEMKSGFSVHIPPMTIHRVEAITDITILEASTNHLDDIVRLADTYGRV